MFSDKKNYQNHTWNVYLDVTQVDEEIETCVSVRLVKDSTDAKTTSYVISDKKWIRRKRIP